MDDCIASLSDDDAELVAQLQNAKAIKARELPARIFLAGLAGPEFRDFWQSREDDNREPAGQDPAIAALQRWRQWQGGWLAGNWQLDEAAFFEVLASIRLGQGGELLRQQRAMLEGLQTAEGIIRQRLQGRPLCLTATPTAAAKHFQGALQSRFIEPIQRRASQLQQRQLAVQGVFSALEDELFAAFEARDITVPEAYLGWQQARGGLFAALLQAHRSHVEAASALLGQCGISPAAP